jgi:AraC family transcriptional activator FtrA
MRARLAEPWSLAALAAEAGMSERTFLRRFRAATGLTPGAWLVEARLARARDLLEETTLPVEAVAAACGFGTAATLRHHFAARHATSPTGHRARFGRCAETTQAIKKPRNAPLTTPRGRPALS